MPFLWSGTGNFAHPSVTKEPWAGGPEPSSVQGGQGKATPGPPRLGAENLGGACPALPDLSGRESQRDGSLQGLLATSLSLGDTE